MEYWLIYAIAAYLLFAINGVTDKFLLSKVLPKPSVYAFYVGVTGVFTFVLAPFGLEKLSATNLYIALVAGACFTFALYFFYSAIKESSISRILPIEAGLVPIFTLGLAFLFVEERLDNLQILAFGLLVAGSILMSFKKEGLAWKFHALKNAGVAALLFALSLTLTKFVYLETNFVSGLLWTRLGLFLGSILFLLSRDTRQAVFSAPKTVSNKNKLLFYGAHIAGALAGLLQNYAISLGSVTIVNALQGVQFAFILGLTAFFSIYFPKILKERFSAGIVFQKIFAMILITIGLVILTL